MTSIVPASYLNEQRDIVWIEVHTLATVKGNVNLGHGSPEEGVHPGVTKALTQICSDPDKNIALHQYTLLNGHPSLLKSLSEFYSPFFERQLNPKTDILVTCGASLSIYDAIMGFVNPGDEVIIVEPFYDQYPPVVELARGVPLYVPLRPRYGDATVSGGDFYLDMEELESKFSSKTKMIILNNPHNPTGKVFTRSELEAIGKLAEKYDALILMDEVYEFLVYSGHKHVKMATLPGMWERTITVGSAGKLFNITGWRIGWAIAPPHLIKGLILVHNDSCRTSPTLLQEAISVALDIERPLMNTEDNYWARTVRSLQAKRDRIVDFLSSVGIQPIVPDGTYFTLANFSQLASRIELTEPGDTKDYKFFRWLSRKHGLICVPMSAFYSEPNKHLAANYVRFCYTKKDSTLEKAEDIIRGIKKDCFQ